MSFKSYATPGKFNPVKVADKSENILRDGEKIAAGMRAVRDQDLKNQTAIRNQVSQSQQIEQRNREANYQAENESRRLQRDAYMQNFKVEQQNAANRSAEGAANMELLMELSGTAFEGYQNFAQAREKGLQDAYAMAVYDSGITTDEAISITKLDTGLTDAALRENGTVKTLLDRGVSLEMVRYLQKVGAGGSNRYLKSKELMQNTVAQAPLEFEQMRTQTFNVAGEPMTYQQAIDQGNLEAVKNIQRQMNRKFITSSGLSQMSPEMLGTMAFPELKSYWKRENGYVMKQVRESMKAKAEEATLRAFDTQYNSDGINGAWGMVENAPSSQRRQARNDFFKWAQEQAESGSTNLTFEQIAGKEVTIEGKTRTIQEWFGRTDEFQDMRKAFTDKRRYERTERKQAFEDRKLEFKEAQQQVTDYLATLPNLTQQQVDQAEMELQQKFPGMKPEINIVVADDRMLAKQEAEVAEMAKKGTLTLAELSKYDYRVFRKFQDVARRYSDAQKSTNKFKEQTKSIENLVKTQPFIKVLPDGTSNPTVPLKIGQLTREFNKRVGERLQAAGPGADANAIGNQVLREITDEFNATYKQTDKNGEEYKRRMKEGYYDVWDGTAPSKDYQEQVNQKLTAIDSALLEDANKALRTPGLVVDQAAAEVLTSTYGQPGWKPGAPATYLADRLGITPLQVINSQLEALNKQGANYELLKPTPSQEAIQQNVRPEVRRILEQYQTPERSTRGLGSSGKWMREVVPNGYGEFVEQASQANGLMPWDLAALAEIESNWNVNAVSPTGAAGIMQIQEKWHPEYTWSSNPQEQIDYGAKYYGQLVQQFGDPVIAAGAYNAGPNRMLEHLETGRPLPAETVEHMKKFKIAQYKYGKKDVLQDPQVMRPSSPVAGALQPLKSFSSQVSSITMDTNQPGIDIFFEDHNFPAVLPGRVKDAGAQYNNDGSGYGNFLVIESVDPQTGDTVDVLYSHLPEPPTQYLGQEINVGEIIGKQGGTGSVQSYDGTIASIDFLAPAPVGSGSMTPYSNYQQLRQSIASQLRR